MDFAVSEKLVQGDRLRLMEVLTLAGVLSQIKFSHYVLDSGEFSITIRLFTDSEEDSLDVQRFVKGYLSPVWAHIHGVGNISSGFYFCDSYKYRFWEEEF